MGEMPSTRSYHVTIQERAVREVGFRRALLAGAVECFLNGEMGVGKTLMRDVINATVGYTKLGELTRRHPKSLMRMFSPAGNPQARNLFEVISRLQEHEGVRLEVTAVWPTIASCTIACTVQTVVHRTKTTPGRGRRPGGGAGARGGSRIPCP